MDFDFKPYFAQYEALVALAEATFDRVRQAHKSLVKCGMTCDDCCYALFDVGLIEAVVINHHFIETYSGTEREQLLEAANRADREIHRIKHRAVKAVKAGKPETEVLTEMGRERVRCPLLTESRQCALYDHRPITCRLYGIPTRIGDQAHTCRLSGFESGKTYPTVNLEPIQRKLYEISTALAHDIGSRYSGLGELLVPVSMALLTDYDEEYLGVKSETDREKG